MGSWEVTLDMQRLPLYTTLMSEEIQGSYRTVRVLSSQSEGYSIEEVSYLNLNYWDALGVCAALHRIHIFQQEETKLGDSCSLRMCSSTTTSTYIYLTSYAKSKTS